MAVRKKKKTPSKSGKAAWARTPVADIAAEQQIVGALFLGKIRNYLSRTGVFAMTLEGPLAVGDTIRIKGHTTDLTQKVERMQADRLSVQGGDPGEAVAIVAADRVNVGDAVYKV